MRNFFFAAFFFAFFASPHFADAKSRGFDSKKFKGDWVLSEFVLRGERQNVFRATISFYDSDIPGTKMFFGGVETESFSGYVDSEKMTFRTKPADIVFGDSFKDQFFWNFCECLSEIKSGGFKKKRITFACKTYGTKLTFSPLSLEGESFRAVSLKTREGTFRIAESTALDAIPFVKFGKNAATGSTGQNEFSLPCVISQKKGEVSFDDTRLSMGSAIGATDYANRIEAAFMRCLLQSRSFVAKGSELFLFDSQKQETMRLRLVERPSIFCKFAP